MIIYCTTNLINGRKYIGLDTKNNPKYLGSGKAFKLALKKYGKENFSKEILYYCNNLQELLEKEEFFIKINNAVKSKEYYNIAQGGGKFITRPICQYDKQGNLLNCWDTIQAVENELGFNNSKITAVAKGSYGRRSAYGFIWRYKGDSFNKYHTTPQWKVSKKQKKQLSKRMTGSKNPMFNKKGKDHPKTKYIVQLSLNDIPIKIWESITEAQSTLKINNISMVLCNKRNKAGGYKWKYFKDIVRSSEKSEIIDKVKQLYKNSI